MSNPIDLTTIAAGNGGFVLFGQDANDYSGSSVASAGDINGDGYDDFIIGAFGADGPGNTRSLAGGTYIVFGKASGFSASIDLAAVAAGTGGFVIHGVDNGDQSGEYVASAGDVNGDGFDDLIIGAVNGSAANNTKANAGESYVVFGKAASFGTGLDLSTLPTGTGTGGFVIFGQDVGDKSGRSVASAGDINGDGFSDLIIGANYAASGIGKTYVVFGKGTGFTTTIDLSLVAAGVGGFVIVGQDADDKSGASVASAGDINGDGFDDLIIGAVFGDAVGNTKPNAGESYVLFGKDTSLGATFGPTVNLSTVAAGTGGFVINGQKPGDWSGWSVASAGDVNGDRFDDIVIGALRSDGATVLAGGAGRSYVVFGKAAGFGAAVELDDIALGTGGFVIYGQDSSDYSGNSVASAGDVNGDGFDDLIIGASSADAAANAKPYAGDSYVVFGKAGGFGASISLGTIAAGTGGFVIHGQDSNDKSGKSVASAGDINGDGFDDIIVGAYAAAAAGNAKIVAGDTYVIFGTDFTSTVTHPGTTGADNIAGTGGDDIMIGGLGNDTLAGGIGNDVGRGGAGADLFLSDPGADKLDGGSGLDTIDYSASVVAISVNLATNLNTLGNAQGDKLTDIEFVIGTVGDDSIIGSLDNNSLLGGLGNDFLDGNSGNDTVDGGSGNDTIIGWLGFDLLFGGDGDDFISGAKNEDTIFGGAGNDLIYGGRGFDVINGDDGNDTIAGDRGKDTITGGSGADHFQFNRVPEINNIDTITDFLSGQDVIELSAAIFTYYSGQIGSFVSLSQNLIYDTGTGVLTYDIDGGGPTPAIIFGVLGVGVHPNLIGNDFLIIV